MSKQLRINNFTYACEMHQSKPSLPSLLMLHGFMGDGRVFDHLMDDLREICNPITVDLLGHGQSTKSYDYRSYLDKNQVGDMVKLIGSLVTPPLYLYGYSMGGRLALKVALSAPDLLDGLVLESTNCGITDPKEMDMRNDLDNEWEEYIMRDFQAFLEYWKTLDLFQSPLPENKQRVAKYYQIQSEQSPKGLSGSLRGFGSGTMPAVCDELKNLKKPVLLLAGSADQKYQRINRCMAGAFPNALFRSIKAGHRVHLDNPEVLITEIKTFIKTHSP